MISTHLRLRAWRIALWGGAASLLLLPLVAMQFTAEVRWDRHDFLAFSAMLLLACGLVELVMRWRTRRPLQWMALCAIAVTFLLVWVELAVGVFH